MPRLQHFVANVGRGTAIRTALAIGVFTLIAAGSLHDGATPPMIAWAAALIVPTLGRAVIVARFELAEPGLRWSGRFIVVGAILLGMARGVLFQDGPYLLPALCAVVGLYLSAYFWLYSDPTVVREAAAA